ncbi:MAG: kynureninase [Ferruginibacter sp.]
MEQKVGIGVELKNTADYAQYLDQQDELRLFRDKFYIPLIHGKEAIYFTGNSLGLQPKATQEYVLNELEDWASFGVEGHLHARHPWLSYHEMFAAPIAKLTGALENEVVVMNQLTVNLHLLMASFYKPTPQRFKIICEAKAFPSDQYMLQSQVQLHGLNIHDTIIEVKPADGEYNISTKDIVETIELNKDSVALVIFGGVNYYSGQVFDMPAICAAAHEAGAYCGFDLAHAIGNIPLQLHHWNVDFATWCSYKYLNSGPGGVSGVYIHERFATDTRFPRMAGWWGQNKESRFAMGPLFDAIPTAEGWQLSNAPILSMAAHKASLDIFEEAGIERLQKKSTALSMYLFFVLNEINRLSNNKMLHIITPKNAAERGCQMSLLMLRNGKEIFEALKKASVIADWREPNVIRIAPVPLYNRFEDVFRFGEILQTFQD